MPLAELKTGALAEFSKAGTLAELEKSYKKYLGRKGKLTLLLRSLGDLEPKERAVKGRELNQAKFFLEEKFSERKRKLEQKELLTLEQKEWLDITAPGLKLETGHLHPITQVTQEIEEIFKSMGFEAVEGPEIETEYYNFDALNIPAEHPSRDIWDTFWLKEPANSKFAAKRPPKGRIRNSKLLLRTHTSPVQIRYMEKHRPPLRIIAAGRCFRHEATDATHDVQFYQLEGLMVDEKVSAANFRGVIDQFFLAFFGRQVKTRLRPSYFPFTEPSFEVDIICTSCMKSKIKNPRTTPTVSQRVQGRQKPKINCPVCKGAGWIELMGAGMVHPEVFKAVGYPTGRFQGFAFGLGLDRLAMLKYKIDDIRLFHSGDMRFLKQF